MSFYFYFLELGNFEEGKNKKTKKQNEKSSASDLQPMTAHLQDA